jgi:hypothetical protein
MWGMTDITKYKSVAIKIDAYQKAMPMANEAKEILLTTNPAYITSKEHDHAEHIKELYDIIMQKTEIKDALNDVKTTYFKSVPQGHLPDEKKDS